MYCGGGGGGACWSGEVCIIDGDIGVRLVKSWKARASLDDSGCMFRLSWVAR